MILRIFNKDLPLHNLLFVIGEGVLIYTAILLAVVLRFGDPQQVLTSNEILGKALLITLVFQLCLYFNDLYNLRVTDNFIELGLRLMCAVGIASITLAVIYFGFPALLLGHGVFLISLCFLAILVVSWRYAYNWILKKSLFTEKIFILGSGKLSRKILQQLNRRRDSGYELAGLITMTNDPSIEAPQGVPLFRYNGDFTCLAQSQRVDQIIVAMDDRRGQLPVDELLQCKMHGIEILEGVPFYEKLTGQILIESLNPSFLVYSDGFRKSRITRLVKRLTDMVVAALGLLLSSPLAIVIALAIKLDSTGPAIFRQKRYGEAGRTFELCKFRSMVADAEAACGHTWARDNDCRVTRVGRILRKYRLDEIPQMWNVLKGEMSFVGPRPERPEFVKGLKELIPYYMERHAVKPGITGWAQVSFGYGASVSDALEKLRYDLFYIKNMSFLMDLIIIFKTVKTVLQNKGAR